MTPFDRIDASLAQLKWMVAIAMALALLQVGATLAVLYRLAAPGGR